ncbi:MAG: class I SAM-dependent methyltransferase, partial [Ignavibacteria bacterium]
MKEHWDKVYSGTDDDKLSWYEEFPAPAVDMLNLCRLEKNGSILIAGAGTSTIVKYLAEEGFRNIIANDISTAALEKLKNNLGDKLAGNVKFIVDDLTSPVKLNKLSNIALWYDRAVLHFFTEEEERLNYFSLLKTILKPGGYAIIAEFSPEGPRKCSSLDTFNYDGITIQNYLGDNFRLI